MVYAHFYSLLGSYAVVNDLAGRLRALRKELRLTIAQMADLGGVSLRSWQDYEAGKKVPGGRVFASLVAANVDVTRLLRADSSNSSRQQFDLQLFTRILNALTEHNDPFGKLRGRLFAECAIRIYLNVSHITDTEALDTAIRIEKELIGAEHYEAIIESLKADESLDPGQRANAIAMFESSLSVVRERIRRLRDQGSK